MSLGTFRKKNAFGLFRGRHDNGEAWGWPVSVSGFIWTEWVVGVGWGRLLGKGNPDIADSAKLSQACD
jgi:hypothetical protein